MRSGRLALAGLIAGAMIAFGLIAMSRRDVDTTSSLPTAVAPDRNDRTIALARCRALADPDEACTKLWEAERRRFLGHERTADRHE